MFVKFVFRSHLELDRDLGLDNETGTQLDFGVIRTVVDIYYWFCYWDFFGKLIFQDYQQVRLKKKNNKIFA